MQSHRNHLIGPRPTRVRRNDIQIRKIGGELIDRRRVRVADHRAQTAGHAGAHARSADIDHHRHFERIDSFPQRIEPPLIDGEMAHDWMKVKTEKL